MKGLGKGMKGLALSLAVALAVTAMPTYVHAENSSAASAITDADFLETSGKNLVNQNGDVVNLRGTNAGGYLLQEFWMTPTKSTANVKDEATVYEKLTERFGKEEMLEIIDAYQDSYWTEADFDNCARLGMNCIRLPFWWRNLVDENGVFYGYDETSSVSGGSVSGGNVSSGNGSGVNTDPYAKAFERMDWFVQQAGQRGMYVILDLHGAPGSQNGSDHSGVDGGDAKEAASEFFFGDNAAANQELYYKIWKVIAERYKDNPAVAGYDLLNEPYCTYRYNSKLSADELHTMLWNIYDKAYDTIRQVDSKHVIIMEATWDPVDLPNPIQYGWSNIMYEYHNYLYDDYDNTNGQQIANMESKLTAIRNADYNVPAYMGEFSYFNNPDAWDEGLELLVQSGINWTTWTYKTTADYGMWGQFHHKEEFNNKIDLETATKEEIKAWYQRMNEVEENTTLTAVTSKWYQAATVSNTLEPKYADIANGEYYVVGNASMKVLTCDGESSVVAATEEAKNLGSESIVPFTLVNNDDGTVSLKTAAGKYISVNMSDKKMYATADAVGSTEKFKARYVSSTTVAFKSVATDTYVGVVPKKGADTLDVLVQSYSINGDESFQLYDKDLNLVDALKLDTYSGWSRYEAEDTEVATIVGGAVASDVAEYSGGAAAGSMDRNDATAATVTDDWSNIKYVKFTVDAPKAGKYLLSMNYNGNDDKEILVKVNAGENQVVSLPHRQGGEWYTLYEQVITVELAKGSNEIYISGTLNNTGWINLDCIDLINVPLGTNDVYTRYEAEDYYTNATVNSQGFYSGGYGVENINSDTAPEDVAFNWSNIKYVNFTIYAEEAGEYTVVWGYTGAGANGMKALYRLNDGENQVITLDNEGGNWNIPNTYSFKVNLKEGFNTLLLSGTLIDYAHYANVDYIDVKPSSAVDSVREPSGWLHYEAENATIVGGTMGSQDFCSKGMNVGYLNVPDISVEDVEADWSNIRYVAFEVVAPRAGDYKLVMAYNGDDDKVGLVKVNSAESQVIELPAIDPSHPWNVIYEKSMVVTLKEGSNTIYISGAIGEGWYDIDYIKICNSEIVVVDEETQTERYEAEFYDTKSSKAANEVVEVQDSEYLTYSGPAHQGVGGMGTENTSFTIGSDVVTGGLNYTNFTIYAEKAGDYRVKLASNGNGANMQGVYQVNDQESKYYAINNEGGSWNTVCYSEFTVTLKKGFNQLLITGPHDSWSNWLNFDYIDVTPVRGKITIEDQGEGSLEDAEAAQNAILTAEEKALIEAGVDIQIILNIDKLEMADVDSTDKAKIEALLDGKTVGLYLDINLFKKIGNNALTPVPETAGKLRIVIPIPQELIAEGRTFSVIYVHNGVAKVLPDLDSNPGTVTIEAYEFSTYALTYAEGSTGGTTGGSTGGTTGGSTGGTTGGSTGGTTGGSTGGTTGGSTGGTAGGSTGGTTGGSTNHNNNTNTSGSGAVVNPTASPKTGDNTVVLWGVMALVAGIVILGATRRYYLKKEDEDFV